MTTFPKPSRLGTNCTRWALSDLLKYEAAQLGESAPDILPESERYLTVKEVAARFSVGKTTVWRWARGE